MKSNIFICLFSILLLLSCKSKDFDIQKVGNLKFTYVSETNGVKRKFQVDIPSDEIQNIFKHLVPKDPQLPKYPMIYGSKKAVISYDGKNEKISWCTIKQKDKDMLFEFRRKDLMLDEAIGKKFNGLIYNYSTEITK